MEGHAKKCVERYCELANKTTQQLHKVSTPCIDDHHYKEEEMKSVGELSQVCCQIVLKCLHLARIGRLDFLWSVNKFARSIKNGPKLVTNAWIDWFHTFIIHVITNKIVMWVILLNNAGSGLFQDSDFAGDLEDSKSTSAGTLCIFGSHTFVPIGWVCKKQTSVFAQFKRTRKHLFGRWIEIRRAACSRVMWFDCFCLWKHDADYRENGEDLLSLKEVRNLKGRSTCWTILTLFFQTSNFRIKNLCCMCLKTTKQWSSCLLKEGVPQWDMFPGLTELHLISCLIELTWTQKSESSTSTPKTNSLIS